MNTTSPDANALHHSDAESVDSAGSDPQTVEPGGGTAGAASPSRRHPKLFGALWAGHWLLRMILVLSLLPYAWMKVFHTQMGYADYADALVQYGEMSPMGLLWRFMAFSPTVQLLAGLAELIAVILLVFRRTAWLGALIACLDMSIVFLLNLTFDVPVKQLSGAMVVMGFILLLPNLARLLRFLLGLPSGPAVNGRISRNRIFIAITRWTAPILGVLIVVGSGVAIGAYVGWGKLEDPSPVAGVYAATEEGPLAPIEGTDHVLGDIDQIAFGQNVNDGRARVGIRYDNGDFQDGTYTVDGDSIALSLFPIREGAQGLNRDHSGTVDFTYSETGEGDFELTTGESTVTIHNDAERRFLFDRGFRWEPGTPINR